MAITWQGEISVALAVPNAVGVNLRVLSHLVLVVLRPNVERNAALETLPVWMQQQVIQRRIKHAAAELTLSSSAAAAQLQHLPAELRCHAIASLDLYPCGQKFRSEI
eukprot:352965-Chlamydomonas_euryale.AAC.24